MQKFYYNAGFGKDNLKERLVEAKVYILRYIPFFEEQKKAKYFLVIGVGIDKVFGDNKVKLCSEDYCDENDLVMLKQAFYSKNDITDCSKGLYYPQKDPTIFHRKWLEKLVHQYDKEPSPIIKYDASITDIRAVALNSVQGISDRASLQSIFENLYFHTPCQSYDCALTGDANRLAYGIIVGNENYVRLPDDLITAFMNNSYSNSMSERIFSASSSLLFIRTHHPYIDIQKKTCLLMTINDLDERNIYEICHSLYLKKEFESIRNQVNKNSKSGIVKKAADRMAYLQSNQLFNFHEADQRVERLFGGLGVTKLSNETYKLVNNYLSNKRFSYSKKQNRWIVGLTMATIIIGVFGLFVNLWPCQIRKLLETKVYFGDVIYPRWEGCLFIFLFLVTIFSIIYFFTKLKMPFDRWFAIKVDSLCQCIHKKAIGDE